MRSSRGLPIAAHLALMLALAFVAAFVVVIAVIIWLPPRPPAVVRGDQLIDRFAAGFQQAAVTGHAPRNDQMLWRIADEPPRPVHSMPSHMLQVQLAERLTLSPHLVRVAAQAAEADMFMYRVRDLDRHMEMHSVQIVHGRDGLQVRESVTTDPPTPSAAREAPAPRESMFDGFHHAGVPPPPPAAAPPAPPAALTPPLPPMFAPPPQGVVLLSGFELAAQLPSGRWLVMDQGRDPAEIGWIGRAMLVVGATLAVLTLIALAFARQLARPIQGFAHAVQAVGVDPQSAFVVEQGPRELRRAARAVNSMQSRLRTLIADRTKTLATVAHDMRTPLMRLRLAAEEVEPAQRERMAKEIGEVEALVASFIAFARDDPAEEARVRLDLSALLQSLVDDQVAAGKSASFEGEERLVITGQSLGLKRLFSNLIDNALKYGGAARVRLSREEGVAIVDVEDDGPGVPADQRESVFKPFVRLTATAGGAGLGLPAARSIARAHGGDIVFLESERGAILRTTLPL